MLNAKRLIITGIATADSIAFAVAEEPSEKAPR